MNNNPPGPPGPRGPGSGDDDQRRPPPRQQQGRPGDSRGQQPSGPRPPGRSGVPRGQGKQGDSKQGGGSREAKGGAHRRGRARITSALAGRQKGEDEYDDIDWDDDDQVDAVFRDETFRGEVSIFDRIPKRTFIAAGAGLFVFIVIISTLNWSRTQFNPPGSPGKEVTLEVPKGSSLSSFATTLDEKGVIPSATAFKLFVKTRSAPQLQAGEYAFHLNSSGSEVFADVKVGPKEKTDLLVIPEGFRLNQIAERVGRVPGFSSQRFLEIANGGTVRSDFQPSGTKSLEGFLFPDTYTLSSSDTEETLIKRMRNQFDNVARANGLERSDRAIGHTPYETLIIASMIEAEARTDGDRGKISQVIQNRLNAPMRLQIDATVLYGLGNTKQTLSNKDLQTPGKYNTYLNNGLPPTPIGNPGRKSIQAALSPTPGSWLFYVLIDADGSHAFSTTLDEHNRNVAAARAKGLL